MEGLLTAAIPARLAWVGAGSRPHVVPIWFHWTGTELAMTTFRGAQKLDDITDGTVVAVTIDTNEFPYKSLKLRGTVRLAPVDGLSEEYRLATNRYLGEQEGERWLEFLDGADQVVLFVSPTWAKTADMAADSPFFAS